MGKIIKFPGKGKEAHPRAEQYNRSVSESTEEQAQFRRSQFRLLKGGKRE